MRPSVHGGCRMILWRGISSSHVRDALTKAGNAPEVHIFSKRGALVRTQTAGHEQRSLDRDILLLGNRARVESWSYGR